MAQPSRQTNASMRASTSSSMARPRLSTSSDTTTVAGFNLGVKTGGASGVAMPSTPTIGSNEPGQYHISSVISDGASGSSSTSAANILLPSLASNPYLPASIASLGTTFTSAGTLPKAASSTSKPVAQRRSQAPPIIIGGGELRTVHMTEFDSYLKEITFPFERWQTESRLGRDGTADLGADEVGEAPSTDVGLGINGEIERAVKIVTPRIGREEPLPPLDEVPQIFFDPAFNLSNPRTFDLVTERIRDSPPNSPTRGLGFDTEPNQGRSAFSVDPIAGVGPASLAELATDQILQEKLSHYTAVIESHLVREIGRRSSSFFSALANLQSLHHQGEETLVKIAELQSALSPDRPGVGGAAKRGLKTLRAQARRRGLETIERGVREVEELWNGVEAVKELVDNGEWIGALEVSEQIELEYYGSNSTNGSTIASPSSNGADDSTIISPGSRRKPGRLRYTRIKALDGLPRKLALMRAQIAKSLETELITVLEHELEVGIADYKRLVVTGSWRRHSLTDSTSVSAPDATSALLNAFGISSPSAGEKNADSSESGEKIARETAKDRVRPVITALIRADGMDGAIAAWREQVLREIRRLVREHLPFEDSPLQEQDDPLAQMTARPVPGSKLAGTELSDKSATLAKRLRAMSHDAFLHLARSTYLGLLAALEIVDVHAHVLSELAKESREQDRIRKAKRKGITDSSPSNSSMLAVPGSIEDTLAPRPNFTAPDTSGPVDDAALYTDINDVVNAVAELANLRFSKVIGVRTEQHAQLPFESFVEVFDASWTFVLRCETICQRMIVGLRGVMVGQAKTFLQAYHQKRLTDSARYVEEEQWAPADIPAPTQHVVGLVVQSATVDPVELLLGQRLIDSRIKENGFAPESTPTAGKTDAKAKQVDIEGRKFFAVSAGVLALDVLADYLRVVVNCPLLITDAMSKVVEFLKSFNSRTCQVVLGAGAMRSAGLKNITAKHLALASQALSIMISLIPYLRECFRRHLNPKQGVLLVEFDKVKRDYQEHQNEIHAKLVAIMGDRLDVHAKSLKSVKWEDQSTPTPSAYMEALVKEHITLHKVLSRFLHIETVDSIMRQVFGALDSRLKSELEGIELRSEAGKRKMLGDVAHLRMRLGDLRGLETIVPGKELEALVASKELPVAVPPKSTEPPKPAPLPPTPTPTPPAPTPISAPAVASANEGLEKSAAEDAVSSSTPPALPDAAPTTNQQTTNIVLPSTDSTSSPRPSMDSRRSSIESSAPPSVTNSPVLNRAPPPNVPLNDGPPRRKSLAERLAEMARRGSTSSSSGKTPPMAGSASMTSTTGLGKVDEVPIVEPEKVLDQPESNRQSNEVLANVQDENLEPKAESEGLQIEEAAPEELAVEPIAAVDASSSIGPRASENEVKSIDSRAEVSAAMRAVDASSAAGEAPAVAVQEFGAEAASSPLEVKAVTATESADAVVPNGSAVEVEDVAAGEEKKEETADTTQEQVQVLTKGPETPQSPKKEVVDSELEVPIPAEVVLAPTGNESTVVDLKPTEANDPAEETPPVDEVQHGESEVIGGEEKGDEEEDAVVLDEIDSMLATAGDSSDEILDVDEEESSFL